MVRLSIFEVEHLDLILFNVHASFHFSSEILFCSCFLPFQIYDAVRDPIWDPIRSEIQKKQIFQIHKIFGQPKRVDLLRFFCKCYQNFNKLCFFHISYLQKSDSILAAQFLISIKCKFYVKSFTCVSSI